MASRIVLVCRLAWRDLRRRPGEAALLLLAITAATTTLTLGLVLQGVTDVPYQSTRDATAGPDVVATVAPPTRTEAADLAALEDLLEAPGVAGHSGPYPYTQTTVETAGVAATALAQGRDAARASVDQPELVDGSWADDGAAVVEASFAHALGIDVGDQITVGGRSFQVAGVAVTAATEPYPKVCLAPCRPTESVPDDVPENVPAPRLGEAPPSPAEVSPFQLGPSGLVWLTEADVRNLDRPAESLSYVLNLKLTDPEDTASFVQTHFANTADPLSAEAPILVTWQNVLDGHDHVVGQKRITLIGGSWLLGLLALASIVVIVGGRMADQLLRVGLLKAVGGTPGMIALVLLAEHIPVALLGSTAGLAIGWMAAPTLTDPGASLLGPAGNAALTFSTIAVVTAAALGIAVVATLVPAVRAARTSAIRALADTARPPRRTAWLISLSSRLPVPLLLALRVAARRPRRAVLGIISIAITVTGIVAALAGTAHRHAEAAPGSDPRNSLSAVLLLLTIMLVAQAAVNTICIVWATTLDSKQSSAMARAIGVTPGQATAGLSAAQVLPALVGALLGLAGGIGLAGLLDEDQVTIPPLWQLLAVVVGCIVVMTALTAVPARIGARRSPVDALRSELA